MMMTTMMMKQRSYSAPTSNFHRMFKKVTESWRNRALLTDCSADDVDNGNSLIAGGGG
jgi:hypothetical protein